MENTAFQTIQTDEGMLPEWADSSEASRHCFSWLRKRQSLSFSCGAKSVQAAVREPFLVLYGKAGKLHRLYGLYNSQTAELTDVSPELRKMLGFPEKMGFRDKRSVEKEAARQITYWLGYYLENQPELFYVLGRQVIPVIDREFIKAQAELFLRHDVQAEDIRYIPEFHFGEDTEPFTAPLYFLYLQKGEKMAQAAARQWIKCHGVEIFQQKVIYGCIRNEFEERQGSLKYRLQNEKRNHRRKRGNEYENIPLSEPAAEALQGEKKNSGIGKKTL